MKTTLKVTPKRRYKTPKYPSYLDQSPLQMSKNVTKTGYYATAFLGVFGLFAFSGTTNTSNEVKENPIKFKELGFPHTYAAFGTGLPDRLNRSTAIKIIDSIFLANKIELVKEYPVSNDGLHFNATGYNKKHNIGYVWLDHNSTAPDCYQSWRGNIRGNSLSKEDMKAYNELKEKIKDDPNRYTIEKEFLKNLSNRKGYYKLLELKQHLYYNTALREQIAKYIKENPNRADEDYGKEILDAYHDDVVDLQEMKQLVKEDATNIAALSMYNDELSYHSYGGIIDEEGNYVKRGGDARKKAIEKLENLVQDYIDWAKSEGRY
ncbi:hypothetical protein KORDIASMS9_02534 [Kordia sp. SMS9]|uniref:hypothetical protein n=1 Tax=Kordia sp. SMS9 TaxID=2282170 RepID=UPI000E0CED58|nr:hypothetical protein [Kordia sp. SMS9]AXG70295.1 hypothetical protein KORDIASMS9_02534 [Kordia sp. SMS9]